MITIKQYNLIDVTQVKYRYMKHCYKRLKASHYGSIQFKFLINHWKSRSLFNLNRLHHFISIAM